MENNNVMEAICMKSKNKIKKGYGYYIDEMSIYADKDGNTCGDCYNEKGEWVGNVNLNKFHITTPNLIIDIKE